MVAEECSQVEGIDVHEVFVPITRNATVQTDLVISNKIRCHRSFLVVKNWFLTAKLEAKIHNNYSS